MSTTDSLYSSKRFYLMTLDPVHVGSGGQRLGRVDLSIVREPGTRLPKIPGTSLNGAIRQYAAYRYESLHCAGAGQGEGEKSHCRDARCPICYTFGYLRGQDGGQSGTVSIGDARLLLFPVYSLAGPVWVTCPGVLRDFDVTTEDPGAEVRLSASLNAHSHLNLGWLMLKKAEEPFQWPAAISEVPTELRQRIALVSDKLFSQVVNSNLEVRTSVSIDPDTGAAAEGALFTYEAIPRAALLWSNIVEDNYRGQFPPTDKKCRVETAEEGGQRKKRFTHNAGDPLGETWQRPLDVVQAGLKLAELLGIGGMGTRGFGRVRLLPSEVVA
jgi:CRISPR-associated protein Cmr4